MADPRLPYPSVEQVAAWLEGQHNAPVLDVAPLSGGFWSSAFAYRLGADEFVLRLSDMSAGFAIDLHSAPESGGIGEYWVSMVHEHQAEL